MTVPFRQSFLHVFDSRSILSSQFVPSSGKESNYLSWPLADSSAFAYIFCDIKSPTSSEIGSSCDTHSKNWKLFLLVPFVETSVSVGKRKFRNKHSLEGKKRKSIGHATFYQNIYSNVVIDLSYPYMITGRNRTRTCQKINMKNCNFTGDCFQ